MVTTERAVHPPLKLENWGGLTVTRNWFGKDGDRNRTPVALMGKTRVPPTQEYLWWHTTRVSEGHTLSTA